MKRNILVIAAAIVSLAFVSCTFHFDGDYSLGGDNIKGNGNIVTQNYTVSAFNELTIALPATVNFTVSDAYTCTIRVDENILEYLEVKVKNEELILKRLNANKNDNLRPTEFVIEVTAPSLEEISLAGSGEFNALSPMEGKELEVNVAGSGDMVFNESVNYPKVEMTVAGSGDIECVKLVAEELEANVAGSGDLKVDGGTVREAEVSIAGSGDIVLTCDIENLEANIAGSGDIKARVNGRLEYTIFGSGEIGYYGNPVLEGNKLGRSSITRLGD